ncbi:MAG: preprotein translocase subunit YajC [Eubacterium sp.]|nr:preprotein translocase subunit YajC [Eubacterium sp.]SEG01887.1 preprotein translocase subunit YajC [Eubacterium ruminantium]
MFFNFGILLDEAASDTKATGGFGIVGIVIYLAFFIGLMYFLLIRPQKKQNKKQQEVMNSIEPGDSIMTTSGFYGTILDVVDDTTVIVEFGNNKNCRIPMHKRAIAEVEKAGTAEVSEEENEK